MATQDISQLVVEVKSQGIQTATNQLNKLADASDKAEAAVTKLGTNVVNVQSNAATSVVSSTRQQTSAIDTLLAKLEEQVSLLGANSQETAAYRAALRGATDSQLAQATALGASIDAYKEEQLQIKATAKAQAEAAAEAEAAARAEAAAYASAQAEAIKMNVAYDSNVQKMGRVMSAAIAMNEAMDRNVASKQAAEYEALWNEAHRLNLEYDKSVQAMGRVQARALEMNAAMDTRAAAQEAKDFEKLWQEATRMNIAFDAAIEKQLKLNAAFEAGSVSSQITRARTAQTFAQGAGQEAAISTYGSAAVNASVPALTAEQAALATATRAARTATIEEAAAFGDAAAMARGLSGSLGMLWVTYGNLIGTAAGLAIGASLIEIVKVGVDVESTLEGIRVKTEQTTDDMAQLRDVVLDVGKGIYGPKEVAKALEDLALAGLNAKQAMEALTPAMNLAVAGGESLQKSAETLVTVGSAVGANAKEYTYLADGITTSANASLASVDSVANAMKRASSVNKLYGASFDDILLQISALSSLGIKDTAAGTAILNMMADMQGRTKKSKDALNELGMSFSDVTGKAKDTYSAFQEFDKLLSKYNTADQKSFITDIFGKQALRDVTELRSLLHETADDSAKYANKFAELKGKIEESAGSSSIAAVQMSLTSENQIKSVWHTLQTSMATAFGPSSGMLDIFLMKMRQAFASPEFVTGLTNLASGVANLAVFLVNMAGPLEAIVEGFVAFKVVNLAIAAMTSVQTYLIAQVGAFNAVTMSAEAASLATKGFAASMAFLPGLGLVIGAVTAALILFNFHSSQVKSHAEETAEAYRSNYLTALQDEADKLDRTVKLLKEGQPLQDAQTQAIKDQARAQADLNNQNAIAAAQSAVNNAQRLVDTADPRTQGGAMAMVAYSSALKEAKENLATLKASVADFNAKADANIASIRANSKITKQAYLDSAKAAEDAAQAAAGGMGRAGKPDKAADADHYQQALKVYTDDIKAANVALTNFDELENTRFKSGQIGRLQVINETADKQIEIAKRIAADAAGAKALADRTPNKTADAQRFGDEAERARNQAAQADKMRTENRVAAQREAEKTITDLKVKSLEAQGKYVEAADLKWSAEGKVGLQQAEADLKQYGDLYPWLADRVTAYKQVRDDAMNSAQLKEDTTAFNAQLAATEATLKGLKAASFGNSIATQLNAAMHASSSFEVELSKLKDKQSKLKADYQNTGSAEALKQYNSATKEVQALTDKQKTMWQDVGDTISKSLTDAFGKPGKALGDLNKAMIEYQQSENATNEDRMKQYGDMAQAASGFFSAQSKGYKLLNGLSQVFHVAEMARTLVRTAAYVAEGAANMFAQGGFGGFAGVAAMGAVMAGLGYMAMGGSVSGADPKMDAEYVQKHQGTGTVFGDADAKSNSIKSSLDELKNNSDVTLPLTQKMVNSLSNIEANMGGLANFVVRSGANNGSNFNVQTGVLGSTGSSLLGAAAGGAAGFGIGSAVTLIGDLLGPIGAVLGAGLGAVIGKLWGKTSQEITDSGLQFGGKVSDLENGQGYNQYANVKTTSSSWFGLSKSSSDSFLTQGVSGQVSQQFGLVFAGLKDALQGAASSLGTTSDAVGKAIDNVVLQTTKVSLKDLKGQDLTDAINNVLSSAMDQVAQAVYPQMQDFEQIGEGYAQTVIRVASGVEQADVALKQLGITAINFQGITNKQGDVATEIARQSILAKESVQTSISSVGGWMSSMFSATSTNLTGIGEIIENMTGSVTDLTAAYKALDAIRTQMNAMGMNGNGLNVDMVSGAGGVSQLQSALSSYQDKYFTDQEKAAIMLKTVSAEFSKLNVALPPTRSALRDLIDQTTTSNPYLAGQLIVLAGDYDTYASALESANSAQTSALNDTIDGLNKFKQSLQSLKSSLMLGDNSVLTPVQKFLEAQKEYNDTVAKAKTGDTTAQDNVSSVAQAYLDASRTINASSQAYTDTYNQVMKDIDSMGASTDDNLSNAEKQLAALQDQSASLDALNATANSMKTDLDTLAGNNAPVAATTTVAVDTSALEAQIADLNDKLKATQDANAQQMDDLKAALYDSQDKNAKAISDAVTGTANQSAWIANTTNNLNKTR